jgi:hypothetical protein
VSELHRNFVSTTLSEGGIDYVYNDPDDLKSMRRWLQRKLSPGATKTTNPDSTKDEPFLFTEPIEGTFKRPAITIRLIDDLGIVTQGHASSNYLKQHLVMFTAYGEDRRQTVAIAEAMWDCFFSGGDPSGARFRIPVWAFDLNARLARFMRVLPESLSMGLDETNEQGEWERGVEARILAPRIRPVPGAPALQGLGLAGTVSN